MLHYHGSQDERRSIRSEIIHDTLEETPDVILTTWVQQGVGVGMKVVVVVVGIVIVVSLTLILYFDLILLNLYAVKLVMVPCEPTWVSTCSGSV